MKRTIWIAAALFLLGGAGCKDSNTTIVFDAAPSESKGDAAGATDAGADHTTTTDSGAPTDSALDDADDASAADAEQGQ